MSDRDVKDDLVGSLCESQRDSGKIPTPVNNERFVVKTLERMDQKAKEPKPETVRDGQRRPGAFQKEAEKRARRHGYELTGNWSVEKKERPLALGGDMFSVKTMDAAYKKLQTRLRLLRSYPEWYDKIVAVNPYALHGHLGQAKRKEAANYLLKILDQSNEKFGHWMKDDPDRPLIFS